MILVTGGTGLVGSHLLLELVRSGESVRSTYRSLESLETVKEIFLLSNSHEESQVLFNKIQWVQADITDVPALTGAFTGIKKVFHCAALVSFDPSRDSELRKINIEGTANVVNCCIDHKVDKLVYVSSIATLDKKPGERIITEDSFWNKDNDHSMYAITKYGGEMEVWRASQEGIPVIILNPGVIIGPGFWNSGSGQLFGRVQAGLNYYPPKITGFVGVWDVTRVLCKLMASALKNEQFILVSENQSFKTILESIATVLHRPVPKKKLSPRLLWLACLLEKIFSPLTGKERRLSRRTVRSIFIDHYYSSEKLLEKTGHTMQPMKEVISDTGKSFLKTIALESNRSGE